MKKPILGPCDSYQLAPFAYEWAWNMSKDCEANTWSPEEIGVANDVADYRSNETDPKHTHLFLSVMAQLTTFDIERGDDVAETFLNIIQPAELKHFLKRLCWEESLHTRSYRYIIENMGIPESGPDNIYDVWKGVPAMLNRIEMAQNISDELLELYYKSIGSGTPLGENIPFQRAFLRAAVFWFLIFEGVWFWVNLLGPVQQLSRLGVYTGAAEQFTYIARDEGQHIVYGVKLINEFLRQYPDCLNHDMINTIQEDAKQAIVLEGKFINYCLKDGSILGYSAIGHVETAKYFVNMRLKSIGLQEVFLGATHRFPWMSEQMEMQKEKNFFEKRVTEYRTGGSLSFDSEEDIQNSEEDQFRSVM